MKSKTHTKKQWALFFAGLIAIIIGVSILSFLGLRKIYREWKKQKLMRENPVVEIADLNIKAPILEGTDNSILSKAVGHFSGSGDFGKGNYCIAWNCQEMCSQRIPKISNRQVSGGMVSQPG